MTSRGAIRRCRGTRIPGTLRGMVEAEGKRSGVWKTDKTPKQALFAPAFKGEVDCKKREERVAGPHLQHLYCYIDTAMTPACSSLFFRYQILSQRGIPGLTSLSASSNHSGSHHFADTRGNVALTQASTYQHFCQIY